jgi:hypothetical protein
MFIDWPTNLRMILSSRTLSGIAWGASFGVGFAVHRYLFEAQLGLLKSRLEESERDLAETRRDLEECQKKPVVVPAPPLDPSAYKALARLLSSLVMVLFFVILGTVLYRVNTAVSLLQQSGVQEKQLEAITRTLENLQSSRSAVPAIGQGANSSRVSKVSGSKQGINSLKNRSAGRVPTRDDTSTAPPK